MADIKFTCPSCSQNITCDELWGGHQIECPSCKNPLMVPAQAPSAATGPQGLVPKPPGSVEPRLAINTGHAAPAGAAPQPQRAIPIRNLTPPPAKKKSAVASIATWAAILIILGAGGYFGYGWYKGRQSADSAEAVAANTRNPAQKQRAGAGQNAAAATDPATDASTNAVVDTSPMIPAVWTLDLAKSKVPSGRANGTLGGTNFVPQSARVDTVGPAQVLRLIEGQPVSPDREVLIYLHLKPGEKLGGQTLNIAQDMAGSGVPQVTKRWKTNPKFAPQFKSFSSGYAMHLELGQVANGALPGKIFLALPDPTQTVVGGSFSATVTTNTPGETVQMQTTVAAPVSGNSAAADAAWQARYGRPRGQ